MGNKVSFSIRRDGDNWERLLSILGMNGYSVYAIPDPEDYARRLICVDTKRNKEEDVK